MQEIITKPGTLLEALPYVQRFRSQVFVVKHGGSFIDSLDPAERHRVAREIVFLEKVQFGDGRVPHSVLLEIFTDAGVGTEVVL
jgi:acetylglutamate kinase